MPVLFFVAFLAFGSLPAVIVEAQPNQPTVQHVGAAHHVIVNGHDTIRSDG